MKKILIGVSTLIAIIGLVGCANPNAITKEEMKTIKFLTGDEIKSMFTDKRIVGTSYRHNKMFDLLLGSNGKVSGTVANGKIQYDAIWYIKDNVKCFEKPEKNKKWCRKTYKVGNKYYDVTEDNVRTADYVIK